MFSVTVSGPHGVGKSTYARYLSEKFNLKYVSAGTLFRSLAFEHQMSVEEFNRYCEENSSIDRMIDKRSRELLERGGVVLDSLLAGWLAKNIANVYKIYLSAPLEVRVKRIAQRENKPYEVALRETLSREESERKRFLEFYGFDISDLSIYDLILNTALFSIELNLKILEVAVEAYIRSRGV